MAMMNSSAAPAARQLPSVSSSLQSMVMGLATIMERLPVDECAGELVGYGNVGWFAADDLLAIALAQDEGGLVMTEPGCFGALAARRF
jgi:hypothetical protein